VARARGGERGAFEELARRHLGRVHGLLFRMVGNHEDAEDLAQESFVRAWSALRWFRGEAGFGPWIWRIALHLARDHQRRRGRRGAMRTIDAGLVAGSDAGSRSGPGSAPNEEASRRELQARLDAELQRLPHRMRAAFVLRTFEGLEYSDVAAVLGISAGTARVHVLKARRQLARGLGPWLDGATGATGATGGSS
jgi:RNA polymerase sigma-70 factor (ECF subfamily)